MSPEGLSALAPCRQDPIVQQLSPEAQVYCVGGAVRDVLLGETAYDRDYLVTGATPEQMCRAGFRPVGRDFPVFLHPITQAEYALARTERKAGQGYKGFVFYTGPEVSLEEDLLRRDLRMNAMAVDEQGALHDPVGGLEDLRLRRLRHVSPAFREDPLRLLRLARFAARWPDFEIAPETLSLCQEMIASGELASLVPERVWAELERGLRTKSPARMVALLDSLKAWASLVGESTARGQDRREVPALSEVEGLGLPLPVLAALLLHPRRLGRLAPVIPRPVQEWSRLLDLGLTAPAWWPAVRQEAALPRDPGFARDLLQWAELADLFRRPDRLEPLLALVWAEAGGPTQPDRSGELAGLVQSLISLQVGSVAQQAGQESRSIPEAVRAYRLAWLCQRLEGT